MDAKLLQQTITNRSLASPLATPTAGGETAAAWNWDFYKFCAVCGFRAKETDAHSVEMFTALRELNKAINRFDSKTLQTLLDAAMNELTD